ncbi:MAG: YlxR family protein [Dehalococcoidia bacterium]
MAAAPARRQPQRTCVACRRTGDKRGLIRLVRTDDGLVIDERGRANGRGAYLCHDPQCWANASTGAVLHRALRLSRPLEAGERAILADFGSRLDASASDHAATSTSRGGQP